MKRFVRLAVCVLALGMLSGCSISSVVSAVTSALPTIDQLAGDATYVYNDVASALTPAKAATIRVTQEVTTRSVHSPSDTIELANGSPVRPK